MFNTKLARKAKDAINNAFDTLESKQDFTFLLGMCKMARELNLISIKEQAEIESAAVMVIEYGSIKRG